MQQLEDFFITRTNYKKFFSYNTTKKFAVDKYVDLAVAKITDQLNISFKKKELAVFVYLYIQCHVFIFQLYFDLHRIRIIGISPFE